MTWVRGYRRRDGVYVRAHDRRSFATAGLAGMVAVVGCLMMLTECLPTDVLSSSTRTRVRVVEVIDGDTFRVRLPGGDLERVRVVGIDTPEITSGSPDCWGPEAAAAARRLLPPQTRVELATDPGQEEYDRYGRRLAFVNIIDGPNFGQTMIERGHARDATYEGDTAHDTYPELEQTAREKRRGLWGSCDTPGGPESASMGTGGAVR